MTNSSIQRLARDGSRLSIGVNTADLSRLADEVRLIEKAGAELVHIDVMDGVFCPILTFGAPIVKSIRTSALKDVHLMIEDPLSKLDEFVTAGADMITVQLESARQPHRVLQALGDATNVNDPARGVLRGIAIAPSTPVVSIEPLLDVVDYVLILGINPGWAGQSFVASTPRRVAEAKELISGAGRHILLGIDGGVTRKNIVEVLELEGDVVVSGSAIFDGQDAARNARHMLDQAEAAR